MWDTMELLKMQERVKELQKMNSKQKGNRFEREICQILRDQGFNAETSRYLNQKDDDLGNDIQSNTGWKIQAKHTLKAPNFHEVLRKMRINFPLDRLCVMHKRNRQGTVVIIELDDFLDLLHETR
jgi:hypothetical protein